MIENGATITLNNNETFIVVETMVLDNKKYLYVINQENMLDIDVFELKEDAKIVSVAEEIFESLLTKFKQDLNEAEANNSN